MIRKMKENGETYVNPIYHWSDEDIWEYISKNRIETNPLYKCGYSRVGCIGCPLATYNHRIKEFNDYPKYKNAYIKSFDHMLKVRSARGLDIKDWKNGQDVFDWWIEEYKYNVKGQMNIDEWLKQREEQ